MYVKEHYRTYSSDDSGTVPGAVSPHPEALLTVKGEQGNIEVLLRTLEPDDQARSLVLNSWSRAVSEDSPWGRRVNDSGAGGQGHPTPLPPHVILHHHVTLLKELIPGTVIRLICDPGQPDIIWGYVSFEEDCLHWCYVKGAFRGYGLGSLLLDESGMRGAEVTVSHRTRSLYEHWPGVRFKWNPYRMIKWRR